MILSLSPDANVNYLAKVVNINEFTPHPNADKMKIAHVGGYRVCVGSDCLEGRYVYFPVNCEINRDILSFCNLYRRSELNSDPSRSEFFKDNGRVSAIKLRGVPSEGFLLPLESLKNYIKENFNLDLEDPADDLNFDIATHNGKSFWICRKYVVVKPLTQRQIDRLCANKKQQKKKKRFTKVIENQFRFHYQTKHIQEEPFAVSPEDRIQLTTKFHGTSHVSAYVLCNLKPTLKTRLLSLFGYLKHPADYDYLYSSKKVVKNDADVKGTGFYDCDVWTEADNLIRPHLIQGMSVYAEIIGYLPNGNYIQPGYDYGCVPPEDGEYISEKNFKVRIYRVTLTNMAGDVHEFSMQEVQRWSRDNGLVPVTELYYGLAKDLYPDIPIDDNWATNFWDRLANDKNFFMECDSPDCLNRVPHEGLVIKKDDMQSRAWKLKTFAFTNREQISLDNGEINIEDEQDSQIEV